MFYVHYGVKFAYVMGLNGRIDPPCGVKWTDRHPLWGKMDGQTENLMWSKMERQMENPMRGKMDGWTVGQTPCGIKWIGLPPCL
jgi:hypothetical protein